MSAKKFDLNIEKILEDWETYDAIREVIANAIDEEVLTETKQMEIFSSDGQWHIRDFGRGLRYEHLTQKEDDEKLNNPNVIGKFGIGLKDALATFDRKGVEVKIKSRYGDMALDKSSKHDFEDLITLHANIYPPKDKNFVGTEFILDGVTSSDIERAKDLFLRFSGEKVLESTKYGDVLEKKSAKARIYVNGVKVADEGNFMFSYNITSLTKAIRKALNRERNNVGRSAYSRRVKSILLSCESEVVREYLRRDLRGYQSGELHDELGWSDVYAHACRLLNPQKRVVFVTPEEQRRSADMVDEAEKTETEVVTVPDKIKEKISGSSDVSGTPVRDMKQFVKERNESFSFKFVSSQDLTTPERKVFSKTDKILSFVGGKPAKVKEIKISETMRKSDYFIESTGLWEESKGRLIIKRDQLSSLKKYASILLHEIAHVKSRAGDISGEFEHTLTSFLGLIVSKAIGEK